MNSRERVLAVLLICIIVFGGGGFFGYQFVYVPWNARNKTLDNLKKDEEAKMARLAEAEKQRAKLARWKSLSLPGDPETARMEYERYLTQLFTRYKITNARDIKSRNDDAKGGPVVGKEPVYTKLIFNVKAYATMANLVAMMEEFYKTGLMQEIKNLSFQRQMTSTPTVRADELDVRMTIEALVITGADKRSHLLPNYDRRLLAIDVAPVLFPAPPLVLWTSLSPGLLSPGELAEPTRDYSLIAKKNIFLGRPPKDKPPQQTEDDGTPEWMIPRYVYLTDITQTPLRMESMLYDRWNNQKIKLRESSGAYNSFPIVRDGKATQVVVGRIVRIDDRKLYYQVDLVVPEAGFGRAPAAARPDKSELEKLVADKVVEAAEAKRVMRYEEEYWEALLRTKAINVGLNKNRFTVDLQRDQPRPPTGEDEEGLPSGSPVEVLKGKVLLRDEGYVYVLPEERYYELPLGASIEDSLNKKPLTPEKVKQLKDVAAN
jgi:hypothetical protein